MEYHQSTDQLVISKCHFTKLAICGERRQVCGQSRGQALAPGGGPQKGQGPGCLALLGCTGSLVVELPHLPAILHLAAPLLHLPSALFLLTLGRGGAQRGGGLVAEGGGGTRQRGRGMSEGAEAQQTRELGPRRGHTVLTGILLNHGDFIQLQGKLLFYFIEY